MNKDEKLFHDVGNSFFSTIDTFLGDLRLNVSKLTENLDSSNYKVNIDQLFNVSLLLTETEKKIHKDKDLFQLELNTLQKVLQNKEERSLKLLIEKETLERKCSELRKYVRNEDHNNSTRTLLLDSIDKLRMSREIVNHGKVLLDNELSKFLHSRDEYNKIFEIRYKIQSRVQFMKRKMFENAKKNDILERSYAQLFQAKDKKEKLLKRKLSASKSQKSVSDFLDQLKKNEQEKLKLRKQYVKEKKTLETNLKLMQSKYSNAIEKISSLTQELSKYQNEAYKNVEKDYPKGEVTFVFTDIEDSTELWSFFGMDVMSEAQLVHDKVMREVIEIFNGYEVKTEGDSFFVSFSSCFDALNFCIVAQERLCRSHWPIQLMDNDKTKVIKDVNSNIIWKGLRVRMGLSMGSQFRVVKDENSPKVDYVGPSVIKAARISDSSRGGEISIGNGVWQRVKNNRGLLENRILVKLKGRFILKGLIDIESIRSVYSVHHSYRKDDIENRTYKVDKPKVQKVNDLSIDVENYNGTEDYQYDEMVDNSEKLEVLKQNIQKKTKVNKDLNSNLREQENKYQKLEKIIKRVCKKKKVGMNVTVEQFIDRFITDNILINNITLFLEILTQRLKLSKQTNSFLLKKVDEIFKKSEKKLEKLSSSSNQSKEDHNQLSGTMEISKERDEVKKSYREMLSMITYLKDIFVIQREGLPPKMKQELTHYFHQLKEENEYFKKSHRIFKKKKTKTPRIKAKSRYFNIFKEKNEELESKRQKKLQKPIEPTLELQDESLFTSKPPLVPGATRISKKKLKERFGPSPRSVSFTNADFKKNFKFAKSPKNSLDGSEILRKLRSPKNMMKSPQIFQKRVGFTSGTQRSPKNIHFLESSPHKKKSKRKKRNKPGKLPKKAMLYKPRSMVSINTQQVIEPIVNDQKNNSNSTGFTSVQSHGSLKSLTNSEPSFNRQESSEKLLLPLKLNLPKLQ